MGYSSILGVSVKYHLWSPSVQLAYDTRNPDQNEPSAEGITSATSAPPYPRLRCRPPTVALLILLVASMRAQHHNTPVIANTASASDY
jgi:hypothetical protein